MKIWETAIDLVQSYMFGSLIHRGVKVSWVHHGRLTRGRLIVCGDFEDGRRCWYARTDDDVHARLYRNERYVTWARGHEGPEVDALLSAQALA